jgi:hypothetical protein
MMTYKMGDVSYDISKLDDEGQTYFNLLRVAMTKVNSTNDEIQVLQAGANYIKDLLEDRLTDEAITEEIEDMEVEVAA